MPTRERKDREKRQQEFDKKMDDAAANAPEHIRRRIGRRSKIGENLRTYGQHNTGWAKYDDDGNPLPRTDPEGLGANLERKEEKESRVKALRLKHQALWGKRGTAKQIAHLENLSVETIRRYMKNYP